MEESKGVDVQADTPEESVPSIAERKKNRKTKKKKTNKMNFDAFEEFIDEVKVENDSELELSANTNSKSNFGSKKNKFSQIDINIVDEPSAEVHLEKNIAPETVLDCENDETESNTLKENEKHKETSGSKSSRKNKKKKNANEDGIDELTKMIEDKSISISKKKNKKKKNNDDDDIDELTKLIEDKSISIPKNKNKKKKKNDEEDLDELTKMIDNTSVKMKNKKTVENEQNADSNLKDLEINETSDNVPDKEISKGTGKTMEIENLDENNKVVDETLTCNVEIVNSTNDTVKNDEAEKSKKKKQKKKKTTTATQQAVSKNEPKAEKKSNKAFLSKMKGVVEKQRLEEERLRAEKEAIQKALEEAEAREREAERIAAEEKDRRKQEKKEKLKQMKEQGLPVTKAQLQKQERLQMMLDDLKAQGVAVPSKADHTDKNKKKRVVYEKKPKHKHSSKVVRNDDMSNNANASNIPESLSSNIKSSGSTLPISSHEIPEELESSVPDNWDDFEDNSPETNGVDKKTDPQETAVDPKTDKSSNGVKKKKFLRSPVICVMGHVDTGKTKILDKLRLTNVQGGEAGGITQQIGVTNVHIDCVKDKVCHLDYMKTFKYYIPGLLLIDTPGHETFRNLRTRGSSVCDIAVLVVDIMHGIEPQTLESFQLLTKQKTPFVIALNKVDRLYQWKKDPKMPIIDLINSQLISTLNEYRDRLNMVVTQFAEKGVNVALYNECPDFNNYIPIVPTSAHSGDGIADLISFICDYSQNHLLKRLTRKDSVLQAVVLEVKSVPGVGIAVDIILINGCLKEGDTVVFSGIEGPVVTQIRAILTAQPMTDLRASKSNYEKHKLIDESQGIRIVASGELEKVIAGTPVLLVSASKSVEDCKFEALNNVENVLSMIQISEQGVYVQASTLGSLEALLDYLRDCKINVGGVNIGPVHKKDVLKASVMLEKDPKFAVILAFDVKVESEAALYAKKENVRIFTADIIYHLTDAFSEYTKECKEAEKEKYRSEAVFPCKLKIMPQFIFNKRDPIVVGVHIEAGSVRLGTPICVPSRDFLHIGTISSIELNHKVITKAISGQEVAVKIEPIPGEAPKMYDRHFNDSDTLVSLITRDSIDICKDYFRDEMVKSDWQLIIELKKTFNII